MFNMFISIETAFIGQVIVKPIQCCLLNVLCSYKWLEGKSTLWLDSYVEAHSKSGGKMK